MQIENNVPLAPLTTFYIGGSARYFVRVQKVEDLQEALTFAHNKQLNIFVLGGGSNVLIRDSGFDGLVIKIELEGIAFEKQDTHTLVVAGAGEVWDTMVARVVEEGLWGIENLSGIPGTVGGAIVQSIGAYGQAVGQCLVWVEVFDTHTNELRTLNVSDCAFTYRSSIFKQEDGRYVVMRSAFLFSNIAAPDISYKDLTERFKDMRLSLTDVREAVLGIRAVKFPDLNMEGTAGSFFKNPILDLKKADALKKTYPNMPVFTLPEASGIKIPLGWLLDNVLHLKGISVGGARLFEKQALVVVAKRNTPARDIEELARTVAQKVQDKIGIRIEPEVKIL